MEFKIRETRTGFYIDLHTDGGELVIEGANRYMFREDAESAIRKVKEPVTYIGQPYVTEDSQPSSWDRSMALSSVNDDNYPDISESGSIGGFSKDW